MTVTTTRVVMNGVGGYSVVSWLIRIEVDANSDDGYLRQGECLLIKNGLLNLVESTDTSFRQCFEE